MPLQSSNQPNDKNTLSYIHIEVNRSDIIKFILLKEAYLSSGGVKLKLRTINILTQLLNVCLSI